MIRIGLSSYQKQATVLDYVAHNAITEVFVFSPAATRLQLTGIGVPVEYYGYTDIIMYETFYPLLEKINPRSLLVFNECLRTQKRSDLTYNCAHHYCNQTPHKNIFEFFPIIDDAQDFMVLLDLENKGKYKGKGFEYAFLQNEDIKIKPFKIELETIEVAITPRDLESYERKKAQLFAMLGEKDPDTILRGLQLLAGDMKKKTIGPSDLYVARNKRFKLANVVAYSDVSSQKEYIVVDMHHRRLNFNDFLKLTQQNVVRYLCTGLPVDRVLVNGFNQWKARIDALYAQASLY